MNAERRREISELVTKMLARKYRCGLAGEHAVRDLWDENIELRARVALLEKVALMAQELVDNEGENPCTDMRTGEMLAGYTFRYVRLYAALDAAKEGK